MADVKGLARASRPDTTAGPGQKTSMTPATAAAPTAASAAAISSLHTNLGNAAVQRMAGGPTTPAAAQTAQPTATGQAAGAAGATAQGPQRPRIDQDIVAMMKADVEEVVAAIRQVWVDKNDETRALRRVQKWASWDDVYRARTGYAGSDYLDKFLSMLKSRTYYHRTARGAWVEQWTNAYDELWHELEDDRLEAFKSLVARSKKEGTGPSERLESAWSYIGKREAAAALGIVKAGGTALGGLADVALWAGGVKGPKGGVAGNLGSQFDKLAKIALPREVLEERLNFGLFKLSSYEFGAAAGKIPYGLALGGALGKAGAVGQAITAGQTAYSASQLGENLAKLRKNLSWAQIAQRPDVWAQVVAVAASAVGVRGGTAGTEALRTTCKQLGIALNVTQSALLVAAFRTVDADPTISAEDKERKKAELLADAASGVLSAADARYGEKFKQAWEAHFTEIGPERQLPPGPPQTIGPERQLPPGPPQTIGPERQLPAGPTMTNVEKETSGATKGSTTEVAEKAKQSSEATERPAAQRPPRQSAVGKGAKGFEAWTRTNTAVGRLPRFSGRSQQFVENELRKVGFREAGPNEWVHPDGSYVRIDPPQDPTAGWSPKDPYYHPTRAPEAPYRSLNESHYHKQWRNPMTNELHRLDDAGYINRDLNQTHIIGR